jgi:hypothetical protein
MLNLKKFKMWTRMPYPSNWKKTKIELICQRLLETTYPYIKSIGWGFKRYGTEISSWRTYVAYIRSSERVSAYTSNRREEKWQINILENKSLIFDYLLLILSPCSNVLLFLTHNAYMFLTEFYCTKKKHSFSSWWMYNHQDRRFYI